MSTLTVEIKKIVDVQNHPNADRLDLIQIEGWWCVSGKGNFKVGDLCVYLPVDSLLPQKLEDFLFPPDSKIKLNNHRIKSIRIRSVFSQGMAIPVKEFFNTFIPNSYYESGKIKEGFDVTALLGVTKYTPPPPPANLRGGNQVKKRLINDNFHKYTDIEHIKRFLNWFTPNDNVVAREKIHGTNFRVGWVKNTPNTWWKKTLQFFKLLPEYEFCFGSRNLQLTLPTHARILKTNPFVPQNAYEKITLEYKFKQLLKHGEVLYGEIYGPNVQKNYHYGLKEGQLGFVAFDLEKDGKYVSDDELEAWCLERNIPLAPLLYKGPFQMGEIMKVNTGNSRMAPTQPVMEGVVIRPTTEVCDARGRKIGKFISEGYALRDDVTEYQ